MIFIFGLARKHSQEKKLGHFEKITKYFWWFWLIFYRKSHSNLPSFSVNFGKFSLFDQKINKNIIFIFSEWPNFFSCKYFLASPKIKIICIIKINTLVQFILRSKRVQTKYLKNHHFLLEKTSVKLFLLLRHTYRRAVRPLWVLPSRVPKIAQNQKKCEKNGPLKTRLQVA